MIAISFPNGQTDAESDSSTTVTKMWVSMCYGAHLFIHKGELKSVCQAAAGHSPLRVYLGTKET